MGENTSGNKRQELGKKKENPRPRQGEDWEEWECEWLWQGRSCTGRLAMLSPPAKTDHATDSLCFLLVHPPPLMIRDLLF